jgi:hypothetical protein
MPTVLIFHEVDDVDHWLRSPLRKQVTGPHGITMRTFVDPQKTNRVGLIAEVPSMEVFQQLMTSPETAEAMKSDGVRAETVVSLVES